MAKGSSVITDIFLETKTGRLGGKGFGVWSNIDRQSLYNLYMYMYSSEWRVYNLHSLHLYWHGDSDVTWCDKHRMRAARYPCIQCTKQRAVSDRKGVCVRVACEDLRHPGVLARC